jgi:hypothetical protein
MLLGVARPIRRIGRPVADDAFSDLLASVLEVLVAVRIDVDPPAWSSKGEVELEALHGTWGI